MILQALKEYYDRKAADSDSGIAPPGWEWKEIPYIIVLNSGGVPVNVQPTIEGSRENKKIKKFLIPQSVVRTSGVTANCLWDTVEYTAAIACPSKQNAKNGDEERMKYLETVMQRFEEFKKKVESLGDIDDIGFQALKKFLVLQNKEELLAEYSDWKKLKEKGLFHVFKLADAKGILTDSEAVRNAINRTALSSATAKNTCLVSGETDEIESTHAKIKNVWGGKSSGGTLVGVNLESGQSFCKTQGHVSPVGKKAAFAFATSLNTMLAKDSTSRLQIGDASTIFWSERQDKFEDNFSDFWSEPPKDNPDRLVNAVKALYRSVDTSAFVTDDNPTRFYVLGLSPNIGRISVRFWQVGTISEFATRFREYFEDLRITHGPKDKDHLSLWRLLVSTAAQGKSENIAPNLGGNVMRSILGGLPFPETLLQATILRIKAEREVSYPRAKLIKGYLNRKSRTNTETKERSLKVCLDHGNTDIGYRLGRLFAALEKIQQEANPGINATIRDKFYASFSSTPRAVLGNLTRLKNHHLAKLENAGRRVYFEKLLGEIISAIPPGFPAHLNLDEQGKFAIGYYHQIRDLFTKKSGDKPADALGKTTTDD